ncbi:hypothetical protein TNCV_2776361 [Trichonephila clavipes]|nr:hypothetical protein TNCV_2776361 [Trichonephila clavipes]
MFYRPFENFTELNLLSPVWCSGLRPTTGVHLTHCNDEFRGPRLDYVRQVTIRIDLKIGLFRKGSPSLMRRTPFQHESEPRLKFEVLEKNRPAPEQSGRTIRLKQQEERLCLPSPSQITYSVALK